MKKILLSALTACSLLSAQAAIFQYSVTLNGPNEPTPSLGTGSGTVGYNDVTHLLQLQVSFTGLVATNGTGVTQSHIHGPTVSPFTSTAGVVITPGTLPGFPLGVTSGNYSTTLDMTLASTYPAAYITANGGTTAGAEAAWAAAMAQGRTYWNIHSQAFPGGEIRGFLVAVPEPSVLALGILGGAALLFRRRK